MATEDRNWYAFLLSILTVATADEALLIVDPSVDIAASKKAFERIRRPDIVDRRTKVKEDRHKYLPPGSKCKHPGCENQIMYRRAHCKEHLEVHFAYGIKGNCTHLDCNQIEYAKGLCYQHYQKSRQKKCLNEVCKNIANRKGYCSACYRRLLKQQQQLQMMSLVPEDNENGDNS